MPGRSIPTAIGQPTCWHRKTKIQELEFTGRAPIFGQRGRRLLVATAAQPMTLAQTADAERVTTRSLRGLHTSSANRPSNRAASQPQTARSPKTSQQASPRANEQTRNLQGASKQARTQARKQAHTQAHKQADMQASKRASKQARNHACMQASRQARTPKWRRICLNGRGLHKPLEPKWLLRRFALQGNTPLQTWIKREDGSETPNKHILESILCCCSLKIQIHLTCALSLLLVSQPALHVCTRRQVGNTRASTSIACFPSCFKSHPRGPSAHTMPCTDKPPSS